MQSSYVVRSQLFLGHHHVPTPEPRPSRLKLLSHIGMVTPDSPESLYLDHHAEIYQHEVRLIPVPLPRGISVWHSVFAPVHFYPEHITLVEKSLLKAAMIHQAGTSVPTLNTREFASGCFTTHD